MSFSYACPPPERSPPLAAMKLSPAPPPGSRRPRPVRIPSELDADVEALDLSEAGRRSESSSLHSLSSSASSSQLHRSRSANTNALNARASHRMSTPVIVVAPKMRNPLPANFEHPVYTSLPAPTVDEPVERYPSPSPSWESNGASSSSRSGSSHCSSTASSLKSKRRRTITAKSSYSSLHESQSSTPMPATPTNGSFATINGGRSRGKSISRVIAGVGDYFSAKMSGGSTGRETEQQQQIRSDAVPEVPKIPAHFVR